ncbi:hypothetical protein Tco_0701426 [Tanacetum coccineum]
MRKVPDSRPIDEFSWSFHQDTTSNNHPRRYSSVTSTRFSQLSSGPSPPSNTILADLQKCRELHKLASTCVERVQTAERVEIATVNTEDLPD